MCLGFWSGLAIAIITYGSGNNIILWPLYGSAVCWFADYTLDIIIKLGKEKEEPAHVDQPMTLLNE
jgi:hypothetical protein